MAIEEVFIEDRIIVGQCLGQTGETCGWDFLERCLVGFISARRKVINLSGFAYKLAALRTNTHTPHELVRTAIYGIITLQITIAITLLSSCVCTCLTLLLLPIKLGHKKWYQKTARSGRLPKVSDKKATGGKRREAEESAGLSKDEPSVSKSSHKPFAYISYLFSVYSFFFSFLLTFFRHRALCIEISPTLEFIFYK